MIGVRCARFGVLTLALLAAACAAPPPKSSAPPALATVEPKALAGPAYRFVPRDVPEFGQRLRLAGGRIGLITDGNPGREIVNPDGSVELSEPAGQGLLGVVALPARLGGGFLFWDTVLYRTHSFLGPLEPIIKLPTNAIGIELGPDYVLLLLTDAPPRAFALDPVRAVPLSPKGVIDVVAASDGRALALDVTGRALASTDAGKSWKDVTAEVGARVGGVDEGEHGVAFVTHKGDAWLQPDGQFVLLPVADKRVPVQDTPALLLLRALSDGLPLPGMRALVGAEGG